MHYILNDVKIHPWSMAGDQRSMKQSEEALEQVCKLRRWLYDMEIA
jgi:hypothetical protein